MSKRIRERKDKRKNRSLRSTLKMFMHKIEVEYVRKTLMRYVRDADDPDEAMQHLRELADEGFNKGRSLDYVIEKLKEEKENGEGTSEVS